MLNLLKDVTSVIDWYNHFKDIDKRNSLIKHAIIAEAKFNKDLAEIICRSNAKIITQKSPEIFTQFSVKTSDILLTIGLPAYEILGDKNPTEKTIQELNKSSTTYKIFMGKIPSELYEFYIRKCRLLKSLGVAGALISSNTSLQRRCTNIVHATKSLIINCPDRRLQ
jgi:hypothetical protein